MFHRLIATLLLTAMATLTGGTVPVSAVRAMTPPPPVPISGQCVSPAWAGEILVEGGTLTDYLFLEGSEGYLDFAGTFNIPAGECAGESVTVTWRRAQYSLDCGQGLVSITLPGDPTVQPPYIVGVWIPQDYAIDLSAGEDRKLQRAICRAERDLSKKTLAAAEKAGLLTDLLYSGGFTVV
jgi:hypothetical protein